MIKFRKIILIVICLFTTMCMFTGCSTVSYGLVQYSNGQILQSFSVVLDEEILTQNDYNIQDTKQQLDIIFTSLVNDLKQDFHNRMISDDNLQIYTQVMQGIKASINDDDNIITLQILFNNITNYKYFYNLLTENENTDDNNDIVTEYVLYNIITTKTYTKFYNYRENPIYLNAENQIKEYFKDSDFTIYNVGFNYCYGLPSSAKYKSNADYIYSQDNMDIHIWKLNSDELNKEIEFYRIQIKPMFWYILAVILTFILLISLVIVCIIKNKFFKNKNKAIDSDKEKEIDEIIENYINLRLNSGVNDKDANDNLNAKNDSFK